LLKARAESWHWGKEGLCRWLDKIHIRNLVTELWGLWCQNSKLVQSKCWFKAELFPSSLDLTEAIDSIGWVKSSRSKALGTKSGVKFIAYGSMLHVPDGLRMGQSVPLYPSVSFPSFMWYRWGIDLFLGLVCLVSSRAWFFWYDFDMSTCPCAPDLIC
jgi:hypothetical protein